VSSKGTLNIKIVGNFITFLRGVKTQDFDTGRRNHEVLKLIEFSVLVDSHVDFKVSFGHKFSLNN
jgi:hypothetical protein